MAKPSITIWMISDGKPGHFNQSLGLIEALKPAYDLSLQRIDTRLRLGMFRSLLKHACNKHTAADRGGLTRLTRLAYRHFDLPRGRPDLIVSCGGQTLYLNIDLARRFNACNFFLGSLRGVDPACLTAVISGLDMPGVSNLVELELSPALFDHAGAAVAGAHLISALALEGQTLWTLLIGGDGAGYHYRDEDMEGLLELMARTHQELGVRWLITTSRRTRPAHEQRIAQFISRRPECIARAILYHQAPESGVMAYLGAAQRVFATEDSSSMISEAIIARKPLITLKPAQCNPNTNYRRFLDKHASRGRLISVDLDTAARDIDQLINADLKPLEIMLDQQIRDSLAPYLERCLG